VANDIIGETQTSFIKGKYILEGVLVLHELRTNKQGGIILKLDFEKDVTK
jgi:hypothetical protein